MSSNRLERAVQSFEYLRSHHLHCLREDRLLIKWYRRGSWISSCLWIWSVFSIDHSTDLWTLSLRLVSDFCFANILCGKTWSMWEYLIRFQMFLLASLRWSALWEKYVQRMVITFLRRWCALLPLSYSFGKRFPDSSGRHPCCYLAFNLAKTKSQIFYMDHEILYQVSVVYSESE